MTDVADKLREARALIEGGWVQGLSRVRRGDVMCYCTTGALWEVGAPFASRHYLLSAIGEPVGLPDWNDAKGRTQAQVLAAFDKAIALAEASQ